MQSNVENAYNKFEKASKLLIKSKLDFRSIIYNSACRLRLKVPGKVNSNIKSLYLPQPIYIYICTSQTEHAKSTRTSSMFHNINPHFPWINENTNEPKPTENFDSVRSRGEAGRKEGGFQLNRKR